MIKLKRLLSGFIDFELMYLIMCGFYNLVISGVENNVLYEKIIFLLLIIYGIFIICSKDIIFKEKSIGKRIFKLYIIDKKMILKVI